MATAGFRGWPSVPTDIRLQILEMVTVMKNDGWRSCAAVCKEWHEVVAKATFQSLRLDNSRPLKFLRVGEQTRNLVRDVQFEAVMNKYGCGECQKDMDDKERDDVNAQLREKLVDLFRLLGMLSQNKNALTLDISVLFPSHTDHFFKNWQCTSDPAHKTNIAPSTWNNHGWVHGKQVTPPPLRALLRPFNLMAVKLPVGLTPVRNVTRLVIRR